MERVFAMQDPRLEIMIEDKKINVSGSLILELSILSCILHILSNEFCSATFLQATEVRQSSA